MGSAATIAESITGVRRRIARAAERSGRDPSSVRLVVATKTVDVARIREAVAAGAVDLGENRVQEAALKVEALGRAPLRWHLLGHLQTNKAGKAARLFDIVQSVDGEHIASALAERRPEEMGPLEVLLEVELTGQPGHTGLRPDAVVTAARAVAALPRLRLRGLMAMAPFTADPEGARPTFTRLRRLRDDTEQASGVALPELSMGMTNDFEVAVEEGATMVRVGRAVFGERHPGV